MKSAILVIDVQAGLFPTDDLPADFGAVIANINELTSKARRATAPVIFIQHETVEGLLIAGTDGWKLHRDLVCEESDVVVGKTTPDSFLRTDLEAKLRSLRVDNLIVCGYASEFCVDTTVRRGAALGFTVILAADAHTTHDKEHLSGATIRQHENATLPNVTSFGVQISAIPVNEIHFSTAE